MRISADIAVAAARELFAAGGTTAKGMTGLTWQERVDALGRGHYVRYDESTATRLGDTAQLVLDNYGGDLRNLATESENDRSRLQELLQRFPGIAAAGADIFCREAQAVWPWLRPFLDAHAVKGAERLGLPKAPDKLAAQVRDGDLARFAAALVRVGHSRDLEAKVRA